MRHISHFPEEARTEGEEENTSEDSNESEPLELVNVDQADGEAVTTAEDDSAPVTYEIVSNFSDSDKTAVYTGNELFRNIVQYNGGIVVKVNGNELPWWQWPERLKVEWKQKNDAGAWGEATEAYPVNAGTYQLNVTLPKDSGEGNDAVLEPAVEFTVTPAPLKVEVANEPLTITPGTKAADYKVSDLPQIVAKNTNGRALLSYDSAPDAQNTLTVAIAGIRDAMAASGSETPEVLVENGDYVLDLTIGKDESKLSDAEKNELKNYTLPAKASIDITMGNLIDTKVEVTLGDDTGKTWKKTKDEEGKELGGITWDYTGATEWPAEGSYTYKVSYDTGKTDTEGNTEYAVIEGAEVTGAWYDESGLKEIDTPVDAGSYQYVISYKDEEGHIYAGSKASIPVTIEPVKLTLVPVLPEGEVIYTGTTAAEVLAKLSYKALDAAGNDITQSDNFDKDSFWGTSYASDDLTQPYEPIFEIREVTEIEADPAVTEKPETNFTYGRKVGSSETLESDQLYRIKFTGDKGVYGFDEGEDTWSATCGINNTHVNSATNNYQVYEDFESLTKDANTYPITLTNGTATEIDVSAILATKGATSSSFENPIISGYDETKGLYAERSEYKKAVVKTTGASATEVAKDYDPSITYKWYVCIGTTETTGEDGTPVVTPSWNEVYYRNSPQNAGIYRLLVSYNDSTHQNRPSSAEVIYQISPLIVSVRPTADCTYTVYTDETVDQFLDWNKLNYWDWYDWSHKESKEWEILPVMEDLSTGPAVEWNYTDYEINWTVQKNIGTAAEADWQDVTSGNFEENAEYRLVGRLERYDGNYVDYDLDETGKDIVYSLPKEINVVKSAGELEVKVDNTKISSLTKVYDGEPFDITENIKNGLIKIVNKATQAEIPYDNWAEAGIIAYWGYPDSGISMPVNGGTYTYCVEFHGSADYKVLNPVETVTVTITPREVTVTPSLKETIVAGSYVRDIYDVRNTAFSEASTGSNTGVIEKDKDAFTWQVYYDADEEFYHYGWPAFAYDSDQSDDVNYRSMLPFSAYDESGNKVESYEKLKGAKTYTVKFDSSESGLVYPYSANYTLKNGTAQSFETVRGNASVSGTTALNVDTVLLRDTISELNHTITAREGIPYYRSLVFEGKERKGNFIAVRIQAPAEYDYVIPATARYENSIKAAGGYIATKSSSYFIAIFEAKSEEKIEFDIRWEDGYVEHFTFDFSGATLIGDLREAVSPKSLSLLSPSKKMAVGETQQLDVKLTKVQQADHIHLSYEVDNKNILCVTDTGHITALSPGDATVTVYASKEQEDGTFAATTPAKKVTLKIKVSDVTAPKIKKTTATDIDVEVQWTKVNDGYRREFYILKGNKSISDFTTAIDSMKNGQWRGIFETAPLYLDSDEEEYYTINKNTYAKWLYGLTAETGYTVYVQNVSAIRTLNDGCKVVKSFGGSIKSFTTTKHQIYKMNLEFDEKVSYHRGEYVVNLSDGSTAVKTTGWFHEIGEKPAANDGENYEYFDGVGYPLPLDKARQANYVNPKLTYVVGTGYDYYAGSNGFLGTYWNADDEQIWIYKSPLATINKKGQLKLKGVGEITIGVKDANTRVSTWRTLSITATPDSIAGKTTKFQVGQSASLDSLLVYKEKNKVLIGSFNRFVIVDADLEKAVAASNGCFRLNGNNITALKPGNLELTLKDGVVGSSATVKLQCKALDPVKGLKTSMITDCYADLEFTHTGSAAGFLVKVEDARKNVIQSTYVSRANSLDASTNKYRYRITGLTKKSKYNVTVTALYGTEESKPAKKSIKTTVLPASYVSLGKNDINEGVNIIKISGRDNCNIAQTVFVAGNTYTLSVGNNYLNNGSFYAATDTLTWTIEGVKNATIKANPGTYTATLKAVKSGLVTIAIKSKVTKATISRYRIRIYAVGDALNTRHYYDENESLDKEIPPSIDVDDQNRLWIGTGKYVYGDNGVSFKAPSTGYYTFYSTGNSDISASFYWYEDEPPFAYGDKSPKNLDGFTSGRNFAKQIYMTAGQTVYISINNETDYGSCYVYVVNQ